MSNNILNIQEVKQDNLSLNDARNLVVMHKGEVYTFFDEGTSRYVYTNKDNTLIVKILKSNYTNFNQEEADIYNKAKDEIKQDFVRTELVNGFIEQDFVMPIKFAGKKLTISQRIFASSCRNEVGWTKDDKLVCFDLDEYKKY